MEENDWQPVRIAPKETIARFHCPDPGEVSKWGRADKLAGSLIRVRISEEAREQLQTQHRLYLHCHARRFVEVHPEDAARLWPEIEGSYIGLCEHQILAD